MIKNLLEELESPQDSDKKQNIKRQYLHWFFYKEISFKVGLSDRNEAFFSLEIS